MFLEHNITDYTILDNQTVFIKGNIDKRRSFELDLYEDSVVLLEHNRYKDKKAKNHRYHFIKVFNGDDALNQFCLYWQSFKANRKRSMEFNQPNKWRKNK